MRAGDSNLVPAKFQHRERVVFRQKQLKMLRARLCDVVPAVEMNRSQCRVDDQRLTDELATFVANLVIGNIQLLNRLVLLEQTRNRRRAESAEIIVANVERQKRAVCTSEHLCASNVQAVVGQR